jgi:hypothetical protein
MDPQARLLLVAAALFAACDRPDAPAVIDAVKDVRAVSISMGSGLCMLVKNGTLQCYEIANGSNQLTAPSALKTADAAGLVLTVIDPCALMLDGTVQCMDRFDYPPTTYGDQAVSAGGDLNSDVCFARRDGTAACATFGGLQTMVPLDLSGGKAVLIAASSDQVCVALADGTVRCWGGYKFDGPGQVVPGLSGVTQLALGDLNGVGGDDAGDFACAVLMSGEVRCWGKNGLGQLGDGTHNDSAAPVAVLEGGKPLTGVTSIASALGHSCAVRTDGSVHCWGGYSVWAKGDGTAGPVSGLDHMQAVATGSIDSGLRADGVVISWGGQHHIGPDIPLGIVPIYLPN